MNMKTELEISEIARNYRKEFCRKNYAGFVNGYTQAQKDMIESASEGFKGFVRAYFGLEKSESIEEFSNSNIIEVSDMEDAWKAARLSTMKDNELLQSWVKHHQKSVEIVIAERAKLKDEMNTLMDAMTQTSQYNSKLSEENKTLQSRLKDAEEVIKHLANSPHPYTLHEHRDTLEHRFGLQIEVAREYFAKYGEKK